MLLARRHARKSMLHTVQRRAKSDTSDQIGLRRPATPDRKAVGPLAEDMKASGLWTRTLKRKPKHLAHIKGDTTRVNVVSEELCNDIIAYHGSSLEKHKGCDLVDLNPGPGLWSSKLHDFLKPRSHILLEPDYGLYERWLAPLTQRPGVRLVEKSGFLWKDLLPVLTPEFLPHQKLARRDDPDKMETHNDTLLLTADIAADPTRKFRGFNSLGQLVGHQLIECINSSGLFQKYGNIRMLLWLRADDAKRFLPREAGTRRRAAQLAELNCEYVREVCSSEDSNSSWYLRDDNLNQGSALWAAQRMQKAGISMPERRRSPVHLKALADAEKGREFVPGSQVARYIRPFHERLAELQELEAKTKTMTAKDERMKKIYRWRETAQHGHYAILHYCQQRLDEVVEARVRGHHKEADKLESELERYWKEEVPFTSRSFWDPFRVNLLYLRQDPALLHWDRRDKESMQAEKTEFFPNSDCTLLDIQPKDCHPLLREMGFHSNRAGDLFGMLVRGIMDHSSSPLSRSLNMIWPGAADWILPRWTSVHDPRRGGVPYNGELGRMNGRMLNATHLEELIELWMQWPLRPSFLDMIARVSDDVGGGDYGDRTGTGVVGGLPTVFQSTD